MHEITHVLVKLHRLSAIALLALVPALTASAATISAKVYSVSGDAEFAPPGSSHFAPMQKGQVLAVGSTVRTGDNGVAVLVTTPGSAIQVGSDSVLKINELAFKKSGGSISQRQAHLELTSGVVSALIDPSTPKVTDFQVATPEGAAAARGTFFAVLVYHGKMYVGVKEGKVGAVANGE
jgi:hypothetical protein